MLTLSRSSSAVKRIFENGRSTKQLTIPAIVNAAPTPAATREEWKGAGLYVRRIGRFTNTCNTVNIEFGPRCRYPTYAPLPSAPTVCPQQGNAPATIR